MIEKLLDIARKNPDGFTVEVPALVVVTSGFVVAYAETQNSFGREGLEKALAHALSHSGFVGGWKDVEDGRFYFDSVRILHEVEEAKRLGREAGQIAIFDLDTETVIFLLE